MTFQKAIKRDAKLRLALCGPSGSGKTFTLLTIATELGGPIAYVDTEHGSASKYAHTDTCGIAEDACADPSHFAFDVVEPTQFDPRDLIKFIDEAAAAGYRCICIDSLSHYWMGIGGELELVDNAAKTQKGNSFAAWKTVTPLHTALVDKMIGAQLHVLVALRTKTEWVIEKNEHGKNTPRKIGLQPIMRDGIEFEFDVCGDLDQDNNLSITKSRCSALANKVINRPGAAMANELKIWLAGAPSPVPEIRTLPAQIEAIFQKEPLPKGAIGAAFTLVKAALVESFPELDGEFTVGHNQYLKTLEHNGIKQAGGNTVAQSRNAVMQCWTLAQSAKKARKQTADLGINMSDMPEGQGRELPIEEEPAQ